MTDAPHLTPLHPADWDPSLGPVLATMHNAPLNVHALMAHHPDLLLAWWNFRNHAVNGGALGRRSAELVILRVALHMRSWYEWASHVGRALDCGLTLDEIQRVTQGSQAPGWARADALLLQAVDELFAGQAISAATLAELGDHYDSRQLLDLIAIQGMYVLLGNLLNTWPPELDEAARSRLPAGVDRATFEAALPFKGA